MLQDNHPIDIRKWFLRLKNFNLIIIIHKQTRTTVEMSVFNNRCSRTLTEFPRDNSIVRFQPPRLAWGGNHRVNNPTTKFGKPWIGLGLIDYENEVCWILFFHLFVFEEFEFKRGRLWVWRRVFRGPISAGHPGVSIRRIVVRNKLVSPSTFIINSRLKGTGWLELKVEAFFCKSF